MFTVTTTTKTPHPDGIVEQKKIIPYLALTYIYVFRWHKYNLDYFFLRFFFFNHTIALLFLPPKSLSYERAHSRKRTTFFALLMKKTLPTAARMQLCFSHQFPSRVLPRLEHFNNFLLFNLVCDFFVNREIKIKYRTRTHDGTTAAAKQMVICKNLIGRMLLVVFAFVCECGGGGKCVCVCVLQQRQRQQPYDFVGFIIFFFFLELN